VSTRPGSSDRQSTAPPPERSLKASVRPGEGPLPERLPASLGLYSQRPPPEAAEEHIALPLRGVSQSAGIATVIGATAVAKLAPGRYSLRPDSDRTPATPIEAKGEPSSTKLLKLDAGEAALYDALAAGSQEAGRELVEKLEHQSERSHDL